MGSNPSYMSKLFTKREVWYVNIGNFPSALFSGIQMKYIAYIEIMAISRLIPLCALGYCTLTINTHVDLFDTHIDLFWGFFYVHTVQILLTFNLLFL